MTPERSDPIVYRILGFDPGVAPAAALYLGPEWAADVFKPMGVKKTIGNKQLTIPDTASIFGLIDRWRPDCAAVEEVGVRSGQGISSSGRFMRAFGNIEGYVQGRGYRLMHVRPSEWYKAFKIKAGDDVSRNVCLQIWPYLAPKLAAKNTHNQADALLIACYAWHTLMGSPVPRP